MSMSSVKIAPSILSADFGRLNEEIATVEKYVDMIHADIMDGHFVPNITFGASAVSKITTHLPLDCHLMIENPEKYIEDFAKALKRPGRKLFDCYIVVHQEACMDLPRVIQQIKNTGVRAGVALNPATPLSTIEPVLNDVDMVLLMTVNPGFGGQKFIESVVPKIRQLRKLMPKLDIEVDGGINDKTARVAVESGANILVAGSYIFGAEDRVKAIKILFI